MHYHLAFHPDCIEVKKSDAQDFLGALDDILRKATPDFNKMRISDI